jgi:hypothetical protein
MKQGKHSKKAESKQALGWTIANTIINLLRLFEAENPTLNFPTRLIDFLPRIVDIFRTKH